MRLGEFLISKNIINQRQLEHALDAQLSYGGHLGTCLIELGYVNEDTLGEVLSAASGARYASAARFRDIPQDVIESVPQKLVEKHRVVPLALENRMLDVAMIDPSNLHAIDELCFATGCKIEPWIAPEVRLFEAMERYYDVPRRVRYVTLCTHLDDERYELIGQRTGFERSLGLAVAPCPIEAPNLHTVPRRMVGTLEEPAPPVEPLESVSELLCRAEGRSQIAEVVLGHTARSLARCILFKVLDSTAVVWDVGGIRAERDDFADVDFPIVSEPMFGLLRGLDCYRGPVPAGAEYRGFFDKLALDRPAEVLMLPVHVNDRLVALFYGDGGVTGSVPADTEGFERLMKKLSLALQIVVLKRKILSI